MRWSRNSWRRCGRLPKRRTIPASKNAFAWEALTCEPADLQDPGAALVFALAAVELGEWQDPDVMDTLALAYHRTGDNARAVEVGVPGP